MARDKRYRAGQANAQGSQICGARRRGTDEPCQSTGVYSNGRCYHHGGPSPKGIASPSYKHGARSKYAVPERLKERYVAAEQDPRLMEMRSEIAMLEARLQQLLDRAPDGDDGSRYLDLKLLSQQFDSAMGDNNLEAAGDAWGRMRRLINRGTQDFQIWGEIRLTLQDRSTLIAAERARLRDMNQMLSVGEALMFADRVLNIITANVEDRDTLRKIQHEYMGMLNMNQPALPETTPAG